MKRKRDDTQEPVDPKRTRLPAQFAIHKEDERDTSVLDSLPYDLKLAILTKMPAKSLVNLRCVSKMWSSIIRTPEFVRSFSSIASTRPPRFIVALSNGLSNIPEKELVFFFSFSPEDQEESSFLRPNFDMAMPGVRLETATCTSVHGYLALQAAGNVTLCNPCTDQFLYFPDGTRYVGYDPIADQHKVLRLLLTHRRGRYFTHVKHQVFTLGGAGDWRHVQPPATMPYTPVLAGVSINGFIYYPAYSPVPPQDPGIVCFDVRYEKLTYINAPLAVAGYACDATCIEYKGKLASIVSDPHYSTPVRSFDLWVLEDVQKHQWSKTTCVIPPSHWDFVGGSKLSFPGTNMAGEIIIAPKMLPRHVQPFYIFYYNVETRNIRRVRLHGIGDNQQFRRSYGFMDKVNCHVHIAPQHIESIAFFKNPPT